MKSKLDNKTLLPKMSLEDKDIQDAVHIRNLMESEGWKILMDYYVVARESIIDAGKSGIKLKDSEKLSGLKFAILKGFDEAIAIPGRIVERAEEYKEKEEQNADAYGDE